MPVRDVRTISFDWVLPEQTKRWETKPTRYISHLLGHEGEGSLLSALKAESLATGEIRVPIFDIYCFQNCLLESALTAQALHCFMSKSN